MASNYKINTFIMSTNVWERTERTAPSKMKDRMLSVSLLMGVESNSGTADLRAAVTWPSAEVVVYDMTSTVTSFAQ